MADEYAEKMSRKSLSELRLYVQNRVEYREDAVLAALTELEQRGELPAEAAAIRAELLPIVEQQRAAAAEAANRPADTLGQEDTEQEGPALYSPGTIVLFSMLPVSTMVGGGILLGINLFKLRRMKALLGLILFVVVYLLVASKLLAWAVIAQGLNPMIGNLLFNVPAMLVYLFWFWPRYVRTDTYRSRSMIPPIIVCFLIVWGLQLALPYLIKQQPKEVQTEMEQLMRR